MFAEHRGDAIVISGAWRQALDRMSDTALDLPLGDPAMGGHSGFGLGLALAQPNRSVVLFDSEGDILMSLGQLATIAEQAPANFYHFILDNEVYATTGGQPVPNAKKVDYAMIARGPAIRAPITSRELDAFSAALPGILRGARPGVRGVEGLAGSGEDTDRTTGPLAQAERGQGGAGFKRRVARGVKLQAAQARDHVALNLARSIADHEQSGVPHVALDIEVHGQAIAAINPHRLGRDGQQVFGGVQIGDRGFLHATNALIDQPGGAIQQPARGPGADVQIGQ